MTAKDFRRLVLLLDGACEGAHMGHPDFRVGGRIFATLHPGNKTGMVKLTPEQQQAFVRDHAAAFAPVNGAWGRGGATLVTLAAADEETLGEAMTLAWQNAVALGPTSTKKKKTARRRS
jgi:YjbR protein